MIGIDQREFNREMGSYISSIRRRASSPKKRGFKINVQKEPDNTYYKEKKPSFWSRIFSSTEKIEEELPPEEAIEIRQIEDEIKEAEADILEAEEMEELAEERKERLLTRLFKKIRRAERPKEEAEYLDEEENMEVIPQLDEDVREILKITFDWINKLPKTKLREFRNSEDFEKYKLVLMKYGLVKEKKE